FPWAASTRMGRLGAANSGTLYVPELCDLPPQVQLEMLKLVQNPLYRVQKLGGDGAEHVNVRILAGTCRFPELVSGNSVSLELLNHFKVRIEIPPLRQRGNDILVLAKEFLDQINPNLGIHQRAVDAIQNHSWPENLNELERVLQCASLEAGTNSEILMDHLPS